MGYSFRAICASIALASASAILRANAPQSLAATGTGSGSDTAPAASDANTQGTAGTSASGHSHSGESAFAFGADVTQIMRALLKDASGKPNPRVTCTAGADYAATLIATQLAEINGAYDSTT